MVEQIQLHAKPRERFLEAAKKELAAFESKEREFRKKLRRERAAQLQLPAVASLSN